jgi:NAD(P)-dependent dehydrogenase (short-subunit alcohol dehydrogenase family)
MTAIRLKPLDRQVIVITGASSGIGLATARKAASMGARVVLAARNGEALESITRELNRQGGTAMYVVADVARREDVERIAEHATDRFGGIDTWINNAGVLTYGPLLRMPEADCRRLFDVNFWGVVSGSLVAARRMERRGGAIINLGSEESDLAVMLHGMYAASKHAVKGFTDALRMELHACGAPISVTLIQPAGIDTPILEHARSYSDSAPVLPPPVYAPEEVAHAILWAASNPRREIFVGGASRGMSMLRQLVPGAADRMNERVMRAMERMSSEAVSEADNLWRVGEDGRVHGNHPGHVMKRSLYTRASMHPLVTGMVLGFAGLLALSLANAALRRREPIPGL